MLIVAKILVLVLGCLLIIAVVVMFALWLDLRHSQQRLKNAKYGIGVLAVELDQHGIHPNACPVPLDRRAYPGVGANILATWALLGCPKESTFNASNWKEFMEPSMFDQAALNGE